MSRIYMSYDPEQRLLLPQDLREWLPEEHLALFVSDVVEQLELGKIIDWYERGDGRGRPPYHPLMMVKLLVYGYCTGRVSSRKIEKATYEDVAFRVLACNQHPDHDSIAEFRKTHLEELARLFAQVLRLCEQAGLVKLGHVAIDGSKLRANASKHKAMSYDRMCAKEEQLAAEVERLLQEAAATDEREDQEYGKGRRGDELPAELARRESRLQKIREAKAALEAEARAQAQAEGRPPDSGTPADKAQRNFTDPEAKIQKTSDGFIQGYNAQIAVDGSPAQIIVAQHVTPAAPDVQQLVPVVTAITAGLGRQPQSVLADAGYWSESNVQALEAKRIEPFIATGRRKHSESAAVAPRGRPPEGLTAKDRMARKLATRRGHAIYARRKAIVEPVFGQIKHARGFRQFLRRGLVRVQQEWALICLSHNLLKLHGATVNG